jgi:hypothetical protein
LFLKFNGVMNNIFNDYLKSTCVALQFLNSEFVQTNSRRDKSKCNLQLYSFS